MEKLEKKCQTVRKKDKENNNINWFYIYIIIFLYYYNFFKIQFRQLTKFLK
jgi:hypothetical protein